jgi:hypothetical protein
MRQIGTAETTVQTHAALTPALEDEVRRVVRDEMKRELARRELESRAPLADTADEGEREVVLQPFSLRKGLRVLHTLRWISQSVPQILKAWADFTREYEAANVTEIDRAFARVEYAPRPLMDEEPLLGDDGRAITDQLGQALVRRTPRLVDGVPVMGPDPLAHLTEEDWQASGNRLRIPRSPSVEERVAAIFPMALEVAEEQTLALLALLSMTNEEYDAAAKGKGAKDAQAAIDARKDELLSAPMYDMLELAIAAGEMVEQEFVGRAKRELADRLPNALRLFGMSPSSRSETPTTSQTPASRTSATSSTDSPPPTDGESDEPSDSPGVEQPLSASA